MAEESKPPAGDPSDLERINRVLLILAVLATGWAVYGMSANIARFWGVLQRLKQVKIMVPTLPLLLVEHQAAFIIIALVIGATCAMTTFNRPDRRSTVFVNIAGIVLLLSWWVFTTTIFYTTAAFVVEMGLPSHP